MFSSLSRQYAAASTGPPVLSVDLGMSQPYFKQKARPPSNLENPSQPSSLRKAEQRCRSRRFVLLFQLWNLDVPPFNAAKIYPGTLLVSNIL